MYNTMLHADSFKHWTPFSDRSPFFLAGDSLRLANVVINIWNVFGAAALLLFYL